VLYNFLNIHVQRLALQFKLLAEEYLEVLKETLPVAPRRDAVDAREPQARAAGGETA
jgi:biopolymer transport protein ExbB